MEYKLRAFSLYISVKMFFKCIVLAALLIQSCRAVDLFVTNGHEAQPHQYPYQVVIYWRIPIIVRDRAICGGAILTPSWVLTSAQCIPRVGSLSVKAAKHLLSENEPGQEVRSVKLSAVHKNYKASGLFRKIPQYDIALLKLDKPLSLNENVKPIALPKSGKKHTGLGFLTGWGGVVDAKESNTLQAAKVPFLDSNSCTEIIDSVYKKVTIYDDQICTGPIGGDISACTSDLGGPVVQFQGNGEPELVGIVSWADTPCAVKGLPTVYTRVSSYTDWIEAKIRAL